MPGLGKLDPGFWFEREATAFMSKQRSGLRMSALPSSCASMQQRKGFEKLLRRK